MSEWAHFFFFNEQCEQIAQVADQKWANHSLFWANCSLAHFLQKMSNSLRKPMSEFPALVFSEQIVHLLIICSFLGKKLVIRSEKLWANSQPCSGFYFYLMCLILLMLMHSKLINLWNEIFWSTTIAWNCPQ